MSIALIALISIWFLAFGAAVPLLWGIKDWRFVYLEAMIALASASMAIYYSFQVYHGLTELDERHATGGVAGALALLAALCMKRYNKLRVELDEVRQRAR